MNRNIKVFITASLLIHLVGGVTLYMYYFAPSPPQLVNGEKEDGSQTKIISPGPNIKTHGKSPKKQGRAKNTGKKVTRQAKNKGAPIKTPLSQKSKVVFKDLPNKNKADPLFKKATGSFNKGMEMSRNSAIKKRDAQKSSSKEIPFSTGEADLANKAGKKAENQDGVSGRSQAEQLKEESAQVKKASSKNTASPIEKTSLATEKGEQQEDTVKNPMEPAPSNEKAPLKVSENKISGEAIPFSNQKEKFSVGSEIKGETVSPSIPENSKSSLKFRNFLNLKQKWGNPKLEYPLDRQRRTSYRARLSLFILSVRKVWWIKFSLKNPPDILYWIILFCGQWPVMNFFLSRKGGYSIQWILSLKGKKSRF